MLDRNFCREIIFGIKKSYVEAFFPRRPEGYEKYEIKKAVPPGYRFLFLYYGWSRKARFNIFPVAFLGSASIGMKRRGIL